MCVFLVTKISIILFYESFSTFLSVHIHLYSYLHNTFYNNGGTIFRKRCIVHISKFSTLATHKNCYKISSRCESFRNCKNTIPLSSLKILNLYNIPCVFYKSVIESNRMCKLCMFSQIHSHIRKF